MIGLPRVSPAPRSTGLSNAKQWHEALLEIAARLSDSSMDGRVDALLVNVGQSDEQLLLTIPALGSSVDIPAGAGLYRLSLEDLDHYLSSKPEIRNRLRQGADKEFGRLLERFYRQELLRRVDVAHCALAAGDVQRCLDQVQLIRRIAGPADPELSAFIARAFAGQ